MNAKDFKDAVHIMVPDHMYRDLTHECVYQCYGCLEWRGVEKDNFCPNCGGTWREIHIMPPEYFGAIEALKSKPTIKLPGTPIPFYCANFRKGCRRQLEPGNHGPYCDYCSGC